MNLFASAVRDHHSPWSSTVDMIQSILSFMEQSRWVRKYLLDDSHQRAQDASILASMEHTKFAYTHTCRQEDNSGSYWTQMFVPAYSDGLFGAGVVSGYSTSVNEDFLCGAHRFAVDVKKGSTLTVCDDPDSQNIVVLFQSACITRMNYTYLRFARAAFLQATRGDCAMDFDLLHRFLVVSVCGSIPANSSPVILNGCYPFPIANIPGDRLPRRFKICAYSNTVPLMSFIKEKTDLWNFHHNLFEIKRLKRLGIASIQRRSPLGIPRQIAPAPVGPHSNAVKLDENLVPQERRKIKKREAAARSYARKREKRIAAARGRIESGNGRVDDI